MPPGLSKKKVSSHHFRCRYCDGSRWLFFRSGQYNPQRDFWKQFLLRATKSCLPESLPPPTRQSRPMTCGHAIAHLDRRSRSLRRAFDDFVPGERPLPAGSGGLPIKGTQPAFSRAGSSRQFVLTTDFQMSMLRWLPLAFFPERTIQP